MAFPDLVQPADIRSFPFHNRYGVSSTCRQIPLKSSPPPYGLEAVVAREVRNLGYDQVTVENGRVTFVGDYLAICRANLWLRTADRVLVKMGQFKAATFDELFEGVKALPWPDWIPEDGEFPVEGRSHKSQLSSVPACQVSSRKRSSKA